MPEADIVGGTAEILLSSRQFSNLVQNPDNAQSLIRALRREQLSSLRGEAVAEAIMGSTTLPELLDVASTAAGARSIVRGATFGFEQNGDAIFTAVVRNWTEQLPERGISEFGSLAEEVAAARSFLEEVLGPIDSEDIVAMLDSIDEAIVSGRSLNLAERNFLDHELLEAQLVASGTPQPAAHLETLLTVPRGSNFSPSVLVNPDVPSPSVDLAFWGLS